MWSGEDVIADIIEETTDSIVITDPIVAVPSPQEGRIAFAPWSPLLQKDKFEAAVMGNDGVMYCMPLRAKRIVKIVPGRER